MEQKTNFQMLKELKKTYCEMQHEPGLLSGEEAKLIRETLDVEHRDVLSLRNLRDFTVLLFREWRENADKVHGVHSDESMKLWDEMSAVTYIIDNAIWKQGGEV